MFVLDGIPTPAAYVAARLYKFGVEDTAKSFIANFFSTERYYIPLNKQDQFKIKIRLYCEAIVLRLLLTEEKNNPDCEFSYRNGELSPNSEGIKKLQAIKSAIKDVELLISARKELSWARNWFASIGHDETNPATLILLVNLIGLDNRTLRGLIHEIGPPTESSEH